MANEKHSKNITQRGNVAKTLVSVTTSEVTFTPAQTHQGGDDDAADAGDDAGGDVHSLRVLKRDLSRPGAGHVVPHCNFVLLGLQWLIGYLTQAHKPLKWRLLISEWGIKKHLRSVNSQ